MPQYLDENGNPVAAPTKVYLDPNTGEPVGSAPSNQQGQAGMLEPHGGPMDLLRGAGAGIVNMVEHPIDTLKGAIQPLMDAMPSYTNVGGIPMPVPNAEGLQHGVQQTQAIQEHPYYAAGEVAGPALVTGGLAKGLDAGLPMVGDAASALRDTAIGDPNAAALRGLRVSAASPKSVNMLNAVEGARPYLQGVNFLSDLQARIPQAKAEVWGPYQRTVNAISNKQVFGPDGKTTVGELEDQRLQLSALNRGLKQQNPEAIQLAQQKGMTQAQLLQQEQAIKDALDPHLESAGIKPADIRKVYGQIAQIGQRVSGKSTVAETPQPYGLGKIASLNIKQPLQAPAQVLSGIRDLVAGRPLYSGSPTDVNLREAFRNAGPKPDLGDFDPKTQEVPIAPANRQLPSTAGSPYEIPNPYPTPMTPGESTAALMQRLRQQSQLRLARQAQPFQLPASQQ